MGAVAEMAAERKLAKYSNLASDFTFQPIAVENLGAFSLSTLEFLSDLGHKLSGFSGEERKHFCSNVCRCRCSVLTLFYGTTLSRSTTFRTNSHSSFVNYFLISTFGNYTPKGIK